VRVVAQTAARAVTAGLVTVAAQGVGSRGALLQVAGRTSIAHIAQTAHVLHGVPRGRVGAAHLGCKVLLRPTRTTVIAVIGAHGTLASSTVIASEALASTGLAIADTLVRALSPRVQVVLVHNATNPGVVLGASAQRAVGAGPLRLTVQTLKTSTIDVLFTGAMA
jgi:hypothetical protein